MEGRAHVPGNPIPYPERPSVESSTSPCGPTSQQTSGDGEAPAVGAMLAPVGCVSCHVAPLSVDRCTTVEITRHRVLAVDEGITMTDAGVRSASVKPRASFERAGDSSRTALSADFAAGRAVGRAAGGGGTAATGDAAAPGNAGGDGGGGVAAAGEDGEAAGGAGAGAMASAITAGGPTLAFLS